MKTYYKWCALVVMVIALFLSVERICKFVQARQQRSAVQASIDENASYKAIRVVTVAGVQNTVLGTVASDDIRQRFYARLDTIGGRQVARIIRTPAELEEISKLIPEERK